MNYLLEKAFDAVWAFCARIPEGWWALFAGFYVVFGFHLMSPAGDWFTPWMWLSFIEIDWLRQDLSRLIEGSTLILWIACVLYFVIKAVVDVYRLAERLKRPPARLSRPTRSQRAQAAYKAPLGGPTPRGRP